MRLLVSVRNAAEARIALQAGADIIDVKEPDAGALGFAGRDVVQDIVTTVNGQVPVSAAMGECVDVKTLAAEGTVPTAPAALDFVKLGLAAVADADASWTTRWETARRTIADASEWSTHANPPRWVAVAYADHDSGTPAPREVLQAAMEAGCAGVLIDTSNKRLGSTPDLLPAAELSELRQAAADAGLFFALAGKITEHHLPDIDRLEPDIVAVRGAVCESSDRQNPLSAERITRLKTLLGQLRQKSPTG